MTKKKSRRLKVLILGNLSPFCIGGAEVQARLIAEALARRGHRVTVAGFGNPNGVFPAGPDSSNTFKTCALSTVRANRLTRAVSYALSLGWFLLVNRRYFDVILCYMLGESDIVVALLKHFQLIDLPMVACTASHSSGGDADRFIRLLFGSFFAELVNRHCEAINIISPRIRNELIASGFDADRFSHIPNGVAIHYCPGRVDRFDVNKRSFLYAGRLVPLKGVSDLIEAASILNKRGHTAIVNITGGGPLGPELRKQIAVSKLCDRVMLLGTVLAEHMYKIYRDNTILVLPSHREAFPMVVVEALACGMPVIVTRSGGPEYIVDERMGLICPPGDPRALADAMEMMAVMPVKQLAQMGAAGAKHVQAHYDIESVTDRFVALFRHVIENR